MKNILTLKKFCLVVAIVGLLHTIVDAQAKVKGQYDNQILYKNQLNIGSVVALEAPVNETTAAQWLDTMYETNALNNSMFGLTDSMPAGYKFALEKPLVTVRDNMSQIGLSTLVETLLDTYGCVYMLYVNAKVGGDYILTTLITKHKDGKCIVISNTMYK